MKYNGMEVSDFWPHQFTPSGSEVQIGEEPLMSSDDGTHSKTMRPIYAQPMHCVHCGMEYMRGKDAQPVGKCPARQTKAEIKRITNS
jgi:hypothetical protein